MGRTVSSGNNGRRGGGVAYDPRTFKMHMVMDLRERLQEEDERRRYKRQLAGAYWLQRATVAYWALRDHVADGEAWYDDDRNVPAYGTARERALLVEARVRECADLPAYRARLYKDVFIWTDDLGAFMFQRTDKEHWSAISFPNASAARGFVDGLQFQETYGGFVVGAQAIKKPSSKADAKSAA